MGTNGSREKKESLSIALFANLLNGTRKGNSMYNLKDRIKAWDIEGKKIRCRSATNVLILKNKIKKSPCVVCGSRKSEAHHTDYKNPKNVIFLCSKHHVKQHVELRKGHLSEKEQERKPVSFSLPADTFQRLIDASNASGLSRSMIVEQGIELRLETVCVNCPTCGTTLINGRCPSPAKH